MIQTVFWSIEILKKNLGEPLSGSIHRNCFSINRISWISFFKNGSWLFQNHFFKSFLSFSLSLWFGLGSTSDFCRFWSFLLQGFSLQIPVRPFYPSFCFYFLFSCILIWDFEPMHIWGFWWLRPYFMKLIIGFYSSDVFNIIFVGKFDQFGDLWKLKNSRACIEPDLGILFNLV